MLYFYLERALTLVALAGSAIIFIDGVRHERFLVRLFVPLVGLIFPFACLTAYYGHISGTTKYLVLVPIGFFPFVVGLKAMRRALGRFQGKLAVALDQRKIRTLALSFILFFWAYLAVVIGPLAIALLCYIWLRMLFPEYAAKVKPYDFREDDPFASAKYQLYRSSPETAIWSPPA